MDEAEKHESSASYRGWVIVLLICAGIILWGVIIYNIVQDSARAPDFGVLPDAPSQSIYTMEPVPGPAAPPQVAPLPEARPPASVPKDRGSRQ